MHIQSNPGGFNKKILMQIFTNSTCLHTQYGHSPSPNIQYFTGELQRKIGLKVLDLGGNAVIG